MLPEETPPSPPAAADPPIDRVGLDPPAMPSADGAPPSAAAEPALQSDAAPGDQPHRRRRRRRRHPPRDVDAAAGADAVAASGDNAPPGAPATDGEPGVADGGTAAGQASGAAQMAGDRPHRRRRRRRRPPPGGLGSALPRDDLAAAPQNAAGDGSRPGSFGDGEPGAAAASPGGAGGATGYLRLPVRRRRRLSHPPGLQRGTADTAPPNADAQGGDLAAGPPRAEGEFPHRRRRRRPPPRIGEAAPAGEGQSAADTRRDGERSPRGRGPSRRPGEEAPRDGQPQRFGERQYRGPGRGPRDGNGGGPPGRERGDRNDRGARGRGPGGPRDGQRGRGRDAPARRIEQKLYALESTVDRGFEDVADEAEDSGTRRVHWTIVKRTVADQKSGKPMSATYVLQREGAETEFPNLGAARAAANKTIVHPEKLTMSKAEHVAAKNSDGRR